jgi:hypothetical protein
MSTEVEYWRVKGEADRQRTRAEQAEARLQASRNLVKEYAARITRLEGAIERAVAIYNGRPPRKAGPHWRAGRMADALRGLLP